MRKLAENLFMKDKEFIDTALGDSILLEATVLAQSIATSRKSQGKTIPGDFVTDSPEWRRAFLDFAIDVFAEVNGDARRAKRNALAPSDGIYF